jgi:hypothetical protein
LESTRVEPATQDPKRVVRAALQEEPVAPQRAPPVRADKLGLQQVAAERERRARVVSPAELEAPVVAELLDVAAPAALLIAELAAMPGASSTRRSMSTAQAEGTEQREATFPTALTVRLRFRALAAQR